MAEWPEHNPYQTEAHRQRAITKRLVILASAIAGVVLGLLVKRYGLPSW